MATLRGKCYWAKVHEPVPNYFEPSKIEYSISVGQLTDEDKEYLIGLGLESSIKEDKKGVMGSFIEFKAPDNIPVYDKKTGEKELVEVEIPVVDADLNPIDEEVLIGNGSEVQISFNPRKWKFGSNSGVKADLKGVQVLELVEFSPNRDPLDEFRGAEADL